MIEGIFVPIHKNLINSFSQAFLVKILEMVIMTCYHVLAIPIGRYNLPSKTSELLARLEDVCGWRCLDKKQQTVLTYCGRFLWMTCFNLSPNWVICPISTARSKRFSLNPNKRNTKIFLVVNSCFKIVLPGSPLLHHDLIDLLFSYMTNFWSCLHPLQKSQFRYALAKNRINSFQTVVYCQFIWRPYIE